MPSPKDKERLHKQVDNGKCHPDLVEDVPPSDCLGVNLTAGWDIMIRQETKGFDLPRDSLPWQVGMRDLEARRHEGLIRIVEIS
ncbi:hypothetical protein ACFL2Q_05490 [Thermodesulfobacteriota bacterium]